MKTRKVRVQAPSVFGDEEWHDVWATSADDHDGVYAQEWLIMPLIPEIDDTKYQREHAHETAMQHYAEVRKKWIETNDGAD